MTIDCKNITVFSGDYTVLNNVSLTIPRNRFTVILGPSGCGKSTLLKVLAGILIPDQGDIHIDGKNVHQLHEKEYLAIKKKNYSH